MEKEKGKLANENRVRGKNFLARRCMDEESSEEELPDYQMVGKTNWRAEE